MKRQQEFLTDAEWDALRALLPPQKPKTGRPAKDHRTVVDAILWQQASGLPWRQLPAHFGPWQTVYSRLRRWQAAGIWDHVQAQLDTERRVTEVAEQAVTGPAPLEAPRRVVRGGTTRQDNGPSTRWSMW